ncbi:formylglycine-generating enzyme family protein [Nocardioides coralli]|uniref:formylglycine-generating enzyme family protein n=1 Tax=Nocardioides coralli TaxID=2872154 RepID=UPI002017301E|nr:formylglycine-generating enzyme family protein [Nocardioides coralli]
MRIPGGRFLMGDAAGDGVPGDGEGPVREMVVEDFTIDATTVTNTDWAAFVDATGHRTEAEEFGVSAVVRCFHTGSAADVVGVPPQAPWWLGVRGASWRQPEGRGSDLSGRWDHPVTHVSWNDAVAYCRWSGRRLPTEAEWEYASRGGLVQQRYPWGDVLLADGGGWRCNIWQGDFPDVNTGDDGWLTTAPVRSYKPNGYGLWQTVGNVWEWCSDTFTLPGVETEGRGRPSVVAEPTRVMRGGSFLCHDSYCNRYRNSARTGNTPDSSTANTGFRTVAG